VSFLPWVAREDEESASERALLVRLSRKDRVAFEQLVTTYQDRIFDFCFRMLGDREEALEMSQETFTSVYQHVSRFRQDAKLSTWVFKIAKNLCLNRLKYLRRRGTGRSDELSRVPEAELVNISTEAPQKPDEALLAARERTRVQRAIALLDEEQRVLVVLRDIEGLSYEEIVGVTELPEGTVKSRLHRARERLGELLAETRGEG
jgi:RNA polymerase sigma-70 factor (ECF subfamily)